MPSPPTYREQAFKRLEGLNDTFLRMYDANYKNNIPLLLNNAQEYISNIEELMEKVAGDTMMRPFEFWTRFKREHNYKNFAMAFECLIRYVEAFRSVPEVAVALRK